MHSLHIHTTNRDLAEQEVSVQSVEKAAMGFTVEDVALTALRSFDKSVSPTAHRYP